MKNNILIKIFSIGLLFLAACESKLDIDPQQSLSTDLAFSDRTTAEGSLLGVYSLGQDYYVFGSLPQIIADYQADNVDFVGSFTTLQEINDYAILADNSSIRDLWRYNYRLILAANAVIAKVPEVEDPTFTDDEKKQFVAEAKFLRDYTYFQLANLFGHMMPYADGSNLTVPLVTEPFTGEVVYPERATLSDMHSFLLNELETIIPDLPDSYDTPEFTRGRATKGAARALLSRIHLYRGEWQDAADYAMQVINSPLYELATSYGFYNGNTSEDVFTNENSATDNGRTGSGGWAEYYNPSDKDGRGDCPYSDDLLADYANESGDKRFTNLTQTGKDAGALVKTFTSKFPDTQTNSDNAPLIRVTEMYLNAAEADAQLNGINQQSIDLINPLRERAGLSDWSVGDFSSKTEFINAILDERRKELAFEGHRRQDLLRNNMPLRTSGKYASVSEPGDPYTILPIPQREIDQNSNLVQNDEY